MAKVEELFGDLAELDMDKEDVEVARRRLPQAFSDRGDEPVEAMPAPALLLGTDRQEPAEKHTKFILGEALPCTGELGEALGVDNSEVGGLDGVVVEVEQLPRTIVERDDFPRVIEVATGGGLHNPKGKIPSLEKQKH